MNTNTWLQSMWWLLSKVAIVQSWRESRYSQLVYLTVEDVKKFWVKRDWGETLSIAARILVVWNMRHVAWLIAYWCLYLPNKASSSKENEDRITNHAESKKLVSSSTLVEWVCMMSTIWCVVIIPHLWLYKPICNCISAIPLQHHRLRPCVI